VTPLAERFQPALLACLALCAIGSWTLSMRNERWESCGDPDLIYRALGLRSAPATGYVAKDGIFEAATRKLDAGGLPVQVSIVRADPPYALYASWYEGLGPRTDMVETSALALPVAGESIPIQKARQTLEQSTYLALALFVYDSRPVASLPAAQLASGWKQLVHGRLPLTMFSAGAWVTAGQEAAFTAAAEAWLAEAWTQHRRVCGG
jgi:hypothetical protein